MLLMLDGYAVGDTNNFEFKSMEDLIELSDRLYDDITEEELTPEQEKEKTSMYLFCEVMFDYGALLVKKSLEMQEKITDFFKEAVNPFPRLEYMENEIAKNGVGDFITELDAFTNHGDSSTVCFLNDRLKEMGEEKLEANDLARASIYAYNTHIFCRECEQRQFLPYISRTDMELVTDMLKTLPHKASELSPEYVVNHMKEKEDKIPTLLPKMCDNREETERD